MSKIFEFYKGKTVLISGATGLIGTLVLEKILSTLTDVERVYLLIRTKKGLTSQERIKKLFSKPVFSFNSTVKTQMEKVFAINADLKKPGLDISEEDRNKIINEVSIVLHMGASIHFNLELEESLTINTLSTKTLLELCTEIKNLQSVVYVSTTYCNFEIEKSEEKIYDFKNINVNEILDQLKEKGKLNAIQKDIIHPHPNCYTVSKRLAEIIVKDFADKLPLSIVRPSIVTAAYQQPIPGWIGSATGISGLLLATTTGIVRVIYLHKECCLDGAPVDCVSNAIIASSWYTTLGKNQNPPVFNITQRVEDKYTWHSTAKLTIMAIHNFPTKRMIWYPKLTITRSYTYYLLATIFFHFLPACIVDGLLLLFQQRPFLINLQRRVWQAQNQYFPFSSRNFHFDTKQMEILYQEMSAKDQMLFYGLNNVQQTLHYLENAHRYGYKYFLKDDGESEDRYILLKVFYILDKLLQILTLYGGVWLILYVFGMTKVLTMNYWCEYNCIS